MKKIKFLNGISATFALAAVALATTFTSCEKEDFNVNFEQNPAKVVFSPNVIDATTGLNVTADATFTGNGEIVSTKSDKSLDAGKVTITATVGTVTGSIEVSYPAVAAGQVVSISPVIMLSSEFTFKAVEGSVKPVGPIVPKYGNAADGVDHNGQKWAKNDSEYLISFTASWNETVTVTKKNTQTKAVTVTAPSEYQINQKGEVKLFAGAWSLYNALFEIQAADIEYVVTSNVSGEPVGTVVYYNPSYVSTASTAEMAIPGHEHSWTHGHGHGDGSNAGGGITLAD